MQALNQIARICVFCASGKEYIPVFAETVNDIVHVCAEQKISIVYGGAKVGLMGLLADYCLEKGVAIQGVITEQIAAFELQHTEVKSMHIADSMHNRKHEMYRLCDAFVVLPGSIGTLDELFEVLCWSKLHIHNKPIGILNSKGYYDTLLLFIQEKTEQGLMEKAILNYCVIDTEASSLLQKMRHWQRPTESNLVTERNKLQ